MRKAKAIRTIFFKDDFQDFLEWDIDEDGVVIDSRPFQASVWVGVKVLSCKVGEFPNVIFRHKVNGTKKAFIRHRVIKVKEATA